MEEKEQIFNAYISLTKLIIENIQIQELKELVKDGKNNIEVKSLGTLKTLEYFITNKLSINVNESKQLMSSLFVLYDLRLLQGHFNDSSFIEKYNFCKERLGLNPDSNHFSVYEQLIENLTKTFEDLKHKTAGNTG